jgi:hypothetical protein
MDLQFQIYNCSARYMRPSLRDLATPFAMQGEAAGVFLIDNISSSSDDAKTLSTVELLATMKLLGTYDVTTNGEAMTLLENRVDEMRTGGWRDGALWWLKRMRDDGEDAAGESGPSSVDGSP